MTKDEAKNLVVQTVSELQGTKATVLASKEQLLNLGFDFPDLVEELVFDFPDLVEELVAEGRLVEVEYILPNMDYRCKSFLLPQGTKVRVKNAKLA